MRIFLIHPEPLYAEVVPRLAAQGIDVVLACVSESKTTFDQFRALLPSTELLSSFDALGAKLPARSRAVVAPPGRDVLDALAPFEATALQMIDRLNYDDRPVQQLRTFYLRYVAMWQALLNAHQPEAVVFHGTPHMGHDYVLYLLCKEAGIRTPIVERAYLDECLFFRESIEESLSASGDEIAAAAATLPDEASPAPAAEHYGALNRALNDVADIRRMLSLPRLALSLIDPRQLLTARGKLLTSMHGLSQKRISEWTLRWAEAKGHLRARRCLTYYEKAARTPDASADYVFYPLHFEPERTTVPDGGRVADQLFVIESLAAALPAGWRLYVKEHPRQFRRGARWNKARSLDFYRRLVECPRVTLVPLEIPSSELVGRARATATITGTAGWEALLAGRPALVFGHPWYQNCPGVVRVGDAESCSRVLQGIAAGTVGTDSRLARAFAEVVRNRLSFRGCFADRVLRLSQLTPAENGASYAAALGRALLKNGTGSEDAGPVRTRAIAR